MNRGGYALTTGQLPEAPVLRTIEPTSTRSWLAMNEWITAWKKCTDFQGRATRTEYWMYTLIAVLLNLVVPFLGPLAVIYWLAAILPGLSVAVRRLHDTGRSGWWMFILLVPVLGVIAMLVWLCTDSERGENGYGPNPKGMNGTGKVAA